MQFLTDFLKQAKAGNLYRKTVTYNPISPTCVQMEGRRYLMLASNNYLGLTHDPAVQQAAIDAIRLYGTGSGGARLTTGTYLLVDQLEQELARFKEAEAALVFNTGYMANLGVLSSLAEPRDVIFSDELNHASIIDGCRLSRAQIAVYRHADMEHLHNLLEKTVCMGKRLIVTDGVFSMDGDLAPLGEITRLGELYDAIIVVDDAHSTGVIGPGGKGTAAHFGVSDKVQVQIGTLSKALGAEGGFVAGSKELIDYIKNKARSFIFSTALAPATIAAALAALRQLVTRPELVTRLTDNTQYVRRLLQAAKLPVVDGVTPIIPIIVGAEEASVRLAYELKQQGIIITAIRPPTVPTGTSRLRLTVNAAHELDELAWAVDIITAAINQPGMRVR
ncbi:8-amino-7-oxononanoate synthase [Sporomusa ovata DSM 2662]|uniref:8-amino-7-ketopelargonate synthase n=1 Tax=Sporomusa ovata TaxID=2378 RepID=A0A0U1KXX8_9FIRM|nr:8-amino-7-oxononanoate synthase [Sporomusa ovata]EQB28854.1 8-amino-7-oxononanoate synthase [Sporomusa ovata DSM 2662]CQR72277.1 8-amino-7-oxononanoate synthase [Sporomusa ovata]